MQERPNSGPLCFTQWHFRAEAEGRTTLTLNYRRSWEEAEPIQTFSMKVVVH